MNERQSTFIEAIGESHLMRVLEFFIEGRTLEYTKADALRNLSMSKTTFYDTWRTLEKREYVIETRTVGRATLYRLNEDHPIVRRIVAVYDETIRSATIASATPTAS